MSAGTRPTPPIPDIEVPLDRFYRLSVEQYQEMAREGILLDGDPVELVEGWLIAKMPKTPPHVVAAGLMRDALSRAIPAGWFVLTQAPITTFDSEPEPDTMVVRGHRRDYRDRHPTPDDVGLVVEVADTSLAYDRTTKRRMYARAGVVHYWIVNLAAGQVEAHSEPTDAGGYDRCDIFNRDADVPLILDGREVGRIAVREILP